MTHPRGPEGQYTRVTTVDHAGTIRTVTLRIDENGPKWLLGVRVNSEGGFISGKGFDQQVHLIDQSTVTKRVPLVMNLHYGMLEEVGTDG